LDINIALSERDDFYGKGKIKKYIDNTVIHIAGFVTRTILKKSKCFQCPLLLISEKSHSSLTEKKIEEDFHLLLISLIFAKSSRKISGYYTRQKKACLIRYFKVS